MCCNCNLLLKLRQVKAEPNVFQRYAATSRILSVQQEKRLEIPQTAKQPTHSFSYEQPGFILNEERNAEIPRLSQHGAATCKTFFEQKATSTSIRRNATEVTKGHFHANPTKKAAWWESKN